MLFPCLLSFSFLSFFFLPGDAGEGVEPEIKGQ